jgi:hypothetical protein
MTPQLALTATARCEACGAELFDAKQRFCGGDRCARVFTARPVTPRPAVNHRASNDPEPDWRERTLRVGSIGYTGTYREPSADDIPEVSVVSVLEARGPE